MGKDLHKSKPKGNILYRAAAVLFCLTLCSTYLVSGLYARYAASGQSSDNARVAKFSMEFSIKENGALSESIQADFRPGDSKDVTLQIQNNSEVAVEYTVAVTNETNNLPLSFGMKKAGSTSAGTGAATVTEQKLPGSPGDEYTLHMEWKENAENAKDPDRYMGKVDYITITVTATQID